MAKVGSGERELNQHLPTAKSGSILRLCHRRYHHGYALRESMEGGVGDDGDGYGDRGMGLDEAGSTDKGLFGLEALSAAFWGWIKEVGWRVPEADRAASYTAQFRLGQVAGVGTAPEGHGRGVDGFLDIG